MACLDENTVIAFFESRLPTAAQAQFDEHVAECEACRRLLAEYAAMAPASNPTVAHAGSATTLQQPNEADNDRAELGRRVSIAQASRRLGSVLCGKWRLDRLIGIGGMAQVFAATHRNGRQVAVKIMRPELAVEPLLVQRFLREGYVANKIGHPGAVAILDDDIALDGAPFLVMELLRGQTLRDRLRSGGPLPVEDALRIVVEVLDVLAAAHDKGVVHRDIKPDNLFETEAEGIKVLDFGIARLRERMSTEGATQSGMTMGTVGYMSPEQARGLSAAVDAQSDVWSVGATLFTLLTGRILHDAATTNEALLLAMTAPIAPLATLVPGLSAGVCALLDSALAFEKQGRFANCRAMQEAARAALRELGVSSPVFRPSSSPPRRSQSGTLLGISASLPATEQVYATLTSGRPDAKPVSPSQAPVSSGRPALVLAAGTAVVVTALVIAAAVRFAWRPIRAPTSSPAALATPTVIGERPSVESAQAQSASAVASISSEANAGGSPTFAKAKSSASMSHRPPERAGAKPGRRPPTDSTATVPPADSLPTAPPDPLGPRQ